MKNTTTIRFEIQELSNEIKAEEAKDFVSVKEVNKKHRNIKKTEV